MKSLAITAAILLTTTAVHGQKVNYDYDGDHDFSGYESFAWLDEERNTPNPMAARRITSSLEAAFEAKGYAMTSANEADFLIDFEATVSQSLRIDETWWGRGRRRSWVREIDVMTYPVGTLAVIAVDGDSREVVWRGVVSGAVTEDRTKIQKRIDKAVKKLLKKFPPPV